MNQELMILLIPLIRVLMIVMLAILVFFVFEGFREFRKFGIPQGEFRLRNLSWNDQPLTRLNSMVYSGMFFVGLGGAYGITVWAAALSHVGALQSGLIAVWFLTLTFSVGLLVFSFTRVLVLGGVLGYWLSWSVSQYWRPGLPTADNADSFRNQIESKGAQAPFLCGQVSDII